MFGRMRISFFIGKRMVHAVKDSVRIRAQVRGPLRDGGKKEKELFPERTHRKHPVRGIAVQEKCLAEKRQVPMGKEENKNCHSKKTG